MDEDMKAMIVNLNGPECLECGESMHSVVAEFRDSRAAEPVEWSCSCSPIVRS
jgi:hypothetical protein